MLTCPNKSSKEWQELVKIRGESLSYFLWNKYSGTIPESEYSISPVNALPKAVEILASDKAKALFAKGSKSMWPLTKILGELQIPKNQIDLILSTGKTTPEDIIMDLLTNYSYTIEINTATKPKAQYYEDSLHRDIIVKDGYSYTKGSLFRELMYGDGGRQEITQQEYDEVFNNNEPTQHYSNLTVPGGINYTEQEISTPLITPSIKGHAQFSTDNGIGWFRSDDKHAFTGFLEDLIASGTIKKVPCG